MRVLALILAAWIAAIGSQGHAQTASAPSVSVPISVYGRLPNVQQMALSPSGKFMVAQISENGKMFLQVRDADTLKVTSQISLPIVKIKNLQWADDSHILITYSVTSEMKGFSGPKREVYLGLEFDLGTGQSRQLLANNDGLKNLYSKPVIVADPGSKAGYAFRVQGSIFKGERGYFSVISEQAGYTKAMFVGDDIAWDYAIGPSGEIVGRMDYQKSNGTWRVFVGPDRWHWKLAQSGIDLVNVPWFSGVSADGKTAYVSKEQDEVRSTYPVDLATATWGVAIPDLEDHSLINAANSEVVIAGLTATLEGTHYKFLDAKDQVLWRGIVKAFGGAGVSFVSMSDDRMKFIVSVDGGDFGYGYYLVDRKTGGAKWLYDVYTSMGPRYIAPASIINYKAADGFNIPAYLTLPKSGGKALPLVVMPHGGPFDRDYAGFDWWAQAYASMGYAVVQPQFRGSFGFGAEHLKAGYGEYGRKMQTDLSDGVAELDRRGVIDPKRVAIVGGSYGGYAALAGVTLQSGIYRCAVSLAGPADTRGQLNYVMTRSGSRGPSIRYWKEYLGVKSEFDPIIDATSPFYQAAKASAPILLMHGTDDTVVLPEQSRKMAEALRKAGKSVEYLELKGEDHNLSLSETRQQMLARSAEFLGQCNPAK